MIFFIFLGFKCSSISISQSHFLFFIWEDIFVILGRYFDTLRACALDVDVSVMAGGDMAYIGEKGVNLSGGQRARIALARSSISLCPSISPFAFCWFVVSLCFEQNRALYHGSNILMLDDVLSAVDAQVAQWILNNALLGPLMDQKTCLLCTHNVQVLFIDFLKATLFLDFPVYNGLTWLLTVCLIGNIPCSHGRCYGKRLCNVAGATCWFGMLKIFCFFLIDLQ